MQRPFSSGSGLRQCRGSSRVVCVRVSAQQDRQQRAIASRRGVLQGAGAAALLGSLIGAQPAAAAVATAPKGFKLLVDKLDGYSFTFPELWTPVTTSGNDVFLRNPFNIEENLFVDISSPSSSRYSSVADLGTPEQAAQALLDQYQNKEFMSTRLGIRRMGEIVSASSRVADDGRTYYDLSIRMASYASRNPYAATQKEVMTTYDREWDRRLSTTLGVANSRLYELRLQSANDNFDTVSGDVVRAVQESFRVKEVDV